MPLRGEAAVLDFQRQLRSVSKQIDVEFDDFVKKIVIDLHTGVILRTPVDKGRARASWRLGIDSADTSTAPDGQQIASGGERVGTGGSAADEALSQQSRFLSTQGIDKHSYHITNSLPYIEPLENGHSKQAPAGMVALTVAEVEAEVRNL